MESSRQESSAPIPLDMRVALNNFDSESLDIVRRWLSKLRERPVPTFIYHYTTDVGLRGILESGKLWLTDIFALNDPSELRHGFSLATDVLDDKAKSGPDEYRLFANNFKEALNEGIEISAHYFVCSFSACGDDLSQWRAYADNGCGYALEFNTEPLEKHFCQLARTSTSDGEAFPVTYDDNKLAEIHRQIIKEVLPITSLPRGKNLSHDALRMYWSGLLAKCAVHLLHPSLYFKHKAYENEKEYRFLELHRADASPDVKFRPRDYELIRYREFGWRSAAAGALKRIVVGPGADCKKSREYADQCLHDCGFSGVEIACSNIPYRPR
jgi:hypothetical protein